MENYQLLPFERNRYYVGKLLTSADFQVEQNFGNQKRRFLNEMMFGSGIVCGLGVYSLDDLSIMVDSGVAMDGNGREIAVESAVVKKLSAIDGFERLQTDRVALCLRYSEEPVHPVYAVRGQEAGEAYECNRIREGWLMTLVDMAELPMDPPAEHEFFSTATLYEDEDYRVSCTLPAQSTCGYSVRLDVTVERLNAAAQPLTLSAVLQTPAFETEHGGHELRLELTDVAPEAPITICHWLTAQSQSAPDSVLLASSESIRVRVGDSARAATGGFLLRASVTAQSAVSLIDQATNAATLESRALIGRSDLVPLAEIVLQRTRNAYLIERILIENIRRYIRTTATAALRQELEQWYRQPMQAVAHAAPSASGLPATQRYLEPIYATGTCEIALGPNLRRGQVVYSDEIIHGLGPGNIFVSVGAEFLAEDAKLGTTGRNTVYGDPSLFAADQLAVVDADTAVKVQCDRGSFVVAARLREETPLVVLTLRWVAVALPGSKEESKLQKLAGKSIAAAQPTVVMSTRSTHYFNVRFKNMEPCTLTYELTEKDSGEITSDGIYTAPGREGVFEIRISCADMPLITTYAYAVVKKRDSEQADDTQA